MGRVVSQRGGGLFPLRGCKNMSGLCSTALHPSSVRCHVYYLFTHPEVHQSPLFCVLLSVQCVHRLTKRATPSDQYN